MATKTKSRKEGYISKIVPKAISQARQDIASWKAAIREASNVEVPKRIRLQRLYNDIMLDAHLVSQIENRKAQTLQTSYSIYNKSGKVDESLTEMLNKTKWLKVIISNILDAVFYGPTIVELLTGTGTNGEYGELNVVTLPRTNFVPDTGILYLDETDTKGIPYREVKEYNTWLIEFGQPKEFGLLNKAVPHVLFKRFAQSCWSELCEIYGIPPRVLKTNTQDPQMLSRGEMMMRDMGAASWYIIDETESFEFAEGVGTNGDVYNNLIKLCKDEISLLIMGAVIGQDTKHGNESKEEVSMKMFGNVVNADRRMVESMINTNVMPALYRIGIIPEGMTLYFDAEEDLPALWNMTKEALPFMEVDPVWIKDKFGIEVTGAKQQAGANFPMPGED
jgi:phage gp29-like protein